MSEAQSRTIKKTGVSIASANSYLFFERSIYEVLAKEGTMEENTCRVVSEIKDRKKSIEVLSKIGLKELMKTFDKIGYVGFRKYVLVNVLLDTFGRINEKCNLKKNDVDDEKGLVTFTETKNGSYRIVHISKKVINLLKELNYETEEYNSLNIFISNLGTVLKPGAFRKNLRDAVAKTTITKKYISYLYSSRQEVEYWRFSRFLRHSELNNT